MGIRKEKNKHLTDDLRLHRQRLFQMSDGGCSGVAEKNFRPDRRYFVEGRMHQPAPGKRRR